MTWFNGREVCSCQRFLFMSPHSDVASVSISVKDARATDIGGTYSVCAARVDGTCNNGTFKTFFHIYKCNSCHAGRYLLFSKSCGKNHFT
jgi:hypothetical protein